MAPHGLSFDRDNAWALPYYEITRSLADGYKWSNIQQDSSLDQMQTELLTVTFSNYVHKRSKIQKLPACSFHRCNGPSLPRGPGSFTMSHWYIIVATHGLIILFTLLLYNVPFCAFAFYQLLKNIYINGQTPFIAGPLNYAYHALSRSNDSPHG